MKIVFHFNNKSFIFFSNGHDVSEQTFWIRGAQLGKQCIYEHFPKCPSCFNTILDSHILKQKGRKLTFNSLV